MSAQMLCQGAVPVQVYSNYLMQPGMAAVYGHTVVLNGPHQGLAQRQVAVPTTNMVAVQQKAVSAGPSGRAGYLRTPCCKHNSWDNVRVAKRIMTLRCRICQKQWRTPVDEVWDKKCELFGSNKCDLGDKCPKMHIHYRKQNLEARVKTHGKLVLEHVRHARGHKVEEPEKPIQGVSVDRMPITPIEAKKEGSFSELLNELEKQWTQPASVAGSASASASSPPKYDEEEEEEELLGESEEDVTEEEEILPAPLTCYPAFTSPQGPALIPTAQDQLFMDYLRSQQAVRL